MQDALLLDVGLLDLVRKPVRSASRLWDHRNSDPQARILDKDRFRQDLGGVIEAYGEILKRVQGV